MPKKIEQHKVKFKFMNHDRIGNLIFTADAGSHPFLVVWKEGAAYRCIWLAESQLERIRTDEADRR